MRYLLDTQVFLWMNAAPDRLGDLTVPIRDVSNELYLSAASSWEIAIKHGLGKITLPDPPMEYVPSRMAVTGVQGLEIQHAHALAVTDLPPHHRDPFDRLIIAQAALEGLTVLTADPVFSRYTDDAINPG